MRYGTARRWCATGNLPAIDNDADEQVQEYKSWHAADRRKKARAFESKQMIVKDRRAAFAMVSAGTTEEEYAVTYQQAA